MQRIMYVAFLAVLITLAVGCKEKTPRLRVGQTLPDITVRDSSGDDVQLRDVISGKLGILLFWESGCVYCKREMPLLGPLYVKYRDAGVLIVGVHVGPGADVITQTVHDNSLTFPMLEDPEARSREAYGLRAVPTMLFIKPNGTIDEHILGGLPADTIEAIIQKKL